MTQRPLRPGRAPLGDVQRLLALAAAHCGVLSAADAQAVDVDANGLAALVRSWGAAGACGALPTSWARTGMPRPRNGDSPCAHGRCCGRAAPPVRRPPSEFVLAVHGWCGELLGGPSTRSHRRCGRCGSAAGRPRIARDRPRRASRSAGVAPSRIDVGSSRSPQRVACSGCASRAIGSILASDDDHPRCTPRAGLGHAVLVGCHGWSGRRRDVRRSPSGALRVVGETRPRAPDAAGSTRARRARPGADHDDAGCGPRVDPCRRAAGRGARRSQ